MRGFLSAENVIYRVYMDYSVPITTIINPGAFVTEGSCAVTNVVLLDPMLIHSAPYTMVELFQANPLNHSVVFGETFFIKRS